MTKRKATAPCNVECSDIPRHPGYRAGTDGSIWTQWRKKKNGQRVLDDWRPLKGTINNRGRRFVTLITGRRQVAHLVLEAFVGPRPDGMEACHYPDPDPLNCRRDNLRWGTPLENKIDQRRHGHVPGGERHHNAKLTNAQVEDIRQLAATLGNKELANRFGVTSAHIWSIVRGRARTPSSHAGRGLREDLLA